MTSDSPKAETYKSLITLSVEGFKFAALTNGGAAVALLSYLGNIASKGAAAPDMRMPMGFFLAGLVCCGIAMFYAYLTQLTLFNEMHVGTSKHAFYLRASMVLLATSLGCFAVGSWTAVQRFS
ncbi:hypothetical protein LJR290_007917 [Variovorax sp. LjRoot290]|uniref:hypothetical protein n=1 Tax=Variovorax sp. LjRoot290 TaxID=3342316 RepID=UPI003ECF45F9